MRCVLWVTFVAVVAATAQAANVFTDDANCVAVWNHESGALATDALGLNSLTTTSGVSATSTHMQGSYAGHYAAASSCYQQITDSELSSGFPGKSTGANRSFSITCWVRFDSLPASNGYHMEVFSKGCQDSDHTKEGFQLEANNYGESIYLSMRFAKASDNASYERVATTTTITTGRWYHVGCSYNHSTKAYHLRVWDETASALLGSDVAGTLADTLYVNAQTVRLGDNSTSAWGQNYLDGFLDEVCVFKDILTTTEIDAIRAGTYGAAAGPTKATSPSPATTATGVSKSPTLTWTAGTGTGTVTHDVYFGVDSTPDSTENKGNQAGASYAPGTLARNKTYYWRVDEKDDVSTTTGDVWSFTTVDTATDYYVDGTDGSDSNDGASLEQAWLTIDHSIASVAAGDTVNIRAGTYTGQHEMAVNGADGSPITFKNYSTEAPVLTTSVAVTGWTQCEATDANLIRGTVTNPHYASIYMVKVADDSIALYENGLKLPISTDPNMSYADWFRVEEMRDIPNEGGNFGGQDDYIVDSTYLTQADDYWNGGKVVVWSHAANNWLLTAVSISDFDHTTHKITFSSALGYNLTNTGSDPDRYVIENHPMILDKAGEWATVSLQGSRYAIYCWPTSTGDLTANMRRSASTSAWSVGGGACIYYTNSTYGHYLTFDGLTIQNSLGGFEFTDNDGSPPVNDYNELTIKNCTVKEGQGCGAYYYYVSDGLIQDCNFVNLDNSPGSGIQIAVSYDCNIIGTAIHSTLGTGIYSTAERITIVDCNIGETGSHGNGISVYQGATDTIIARNTITTTKCSITLQDANNVCIFGNVIYKSAGASDVIDWGGCVGKLAVVNNVLVGGVSIPYGPTGSSGTSTSSLIVVDNIMSASAFGDATTHTNNIYLATPAHTLGSDESVVTDTSSIFTNYAGHDYSLVVGSPAINAGIDPAAYLPTTIFPAFDFTTDHAGSSWGTVRELGAYAYAQTTPAASESKANPTPPERRDFLRDRRR